MCYNFFLHINDNNIVANKVKHYSGQSLNVYNDQPTCTKSDNNAPIMDTPGAKGKCYKRESVNYCRVLILTSTGKQDRKQPILPPGKSANQPSQKPMVPTVHDDEPISIVNEVKYAQPGATYHPALSPQQVLSSSTSSQYQGLRVSGVDVSSAYSVPRDFDLDGSKAEADPKYANLPM